MYILLLIPWHNILMVASCCLLLLGKNQRLAKAPDQDQVTLRVGLTFQASILYSLSIFYGGIGDNIEHLMPFLY